MARGSLFWQLFLFGCSMQIMSVASEDEPLEYMSREEREALKEEARDMFYHAYNAYMDNAYPADELMPLSCKGRYRGSEPNRGDIDSTLGNFSLTLVDTLDTLVVLGDLEEFENAVKLVARDVSFDTDVIVSLFETNIRMLGGLLSGHILAEYLQQRADIMPWYRGELLNLAKDLGYRFLPAFNTTTGIPYGRINLKYGMKGVPPEASRETCTACAGTMILEMAALSRLTGESIFEQKAQKAMDVLWKLRHRGTDLMGSVLNVNSGDWVRRDSGVGAGIDSYYEYCLKAYILLGDEKYLGRFNKHYQAVMRYISQGPMLLDVHMHRPYTNSKNFMDALLAFWPGLQVLKGDIKPAVETHEMLYQVMQRHNFIPEAFTTDFQVHWGHHPLRPEFLESTYFLYRATGDHYYLAVGRKVLKSLQTYARVACGYAAVSDVRTNKHDDTMDSFVLSETFKYLFLLFAEPSELVLDLDEFIFTTEGHLLPLTLASVRTNVSSELERDAVHVDEMDRTCPNSLHLFPASVRQPLRNMVEDVCPRRTIKRRLSAVQFQANNLEHLKMLSDMGITTLTLADGRVQLLHTFSNAKTPQDSEEGLLFMQEMVEISKMQAQQVETKPQTVSFIKPGTIPAQQVTLLAGPAHFGLDLQKLNKVTAKVVYAYPLTACTELVNSKQVVGKIAIVKRGNCMFIEKARRIQQAGAVAGIVLDNFEGSSAATSPMFAMSGDGKEVDDVMIPVVFLFSTEADELINAIRDTDGDFYATLGHFFSKEEVQLKAPTDLSMFERLKGSLKSFLTQQVTPQTSPSTGSNVDLVLSDIKTSGDEEDVVMCTKDDLCVQIIKDPLGGEVRIRSSEVKIFRETELHKHPPEKSEEPTTVEKRWRQLREVFANLIYSKPKLMAGLNIRTYILENYYEWVLKARGADEAVLKVPLRSKVLWFLSELTEVSPNPSVTKQLSEANKQRLLRQYLLTRMDVSVLHRKNIVEILKAFAKGTFSTKRLMTNLVNSNSAHNMLFNVLYRSLQKVPPAPDEDYSEHLKLLQRVKEEVNQEYQDVLTLSTQKEFVRTPNLAEQSSYYDMVIENWKTEIQNRRVFNVFTNSLADIMGDNSEYSKVEVKKKESTATTNEELKPEKLEDYESFILSEIDKAAQNYEDNTFAQYIQYQEALNNEGSTDEPDIKETIESGKVLIDISPKNQSKREKKSNASVYKSKKNKKFDDLMKSIDTLDDLNKLDKSKEFTDLPNLSKPKRSTLDAFMKNTESRTSPPGLNNDDGLAQPQAKDLEEFEQTNSNKMKSLVSDNEEFLPNTITNTLNPKETGSRENESSINSRKSLDLQNEIASDQNVKTKSSEANGIPPEVLEHVVSNYGVLEYDMLVEIRNPIMEGNQEKEKRSPGVRGDMGVSDMDSNSGDNSDLGRQRKHVTKIENNDADKSLHESKHIEDEL